MFSALLLSAIIPGMDARAFNSTVGINTHISEEYAPSNNFNFTTAMLKALNIRYVRDSLAIEPGANNKFRNYLQLIDDSDHADAIRTDQLVNVNGWQGSDIVGHVTFWGVDFFEGSNEADIQGDAAWLAHTQALMAQIAVAQKTYPGIKSIAPTVVYADPATLNITANLGNMHDYFGTFNPETVGYGSDVYGNGTLYGSEAYNIALARRAVPGAPVVSTESGYDTSVVSEAVAAAYTVRLMLVHAMNGVVRGYLYNLFDDSQRFGLVRADGSMKPSAYAVSGFLSIVNDTTASSGACSLTATVTAPVPVQSYVICKSTGEKDLVLWNPSPIVNTSPTNYASVSVVSPGVVRTYVPDVTYHYLENDTPNLLSVPFSGSPSIVQLNAGVRPVLPSLPGEP